MLKLPLVPQTFDYSCGAACFESMYRHFREDSPGEIVFAKQLGTLDFNYTPLENIYQLALSLGFKALLNSEAPFEDLFFSFQKGRITFVTWWDEDAGHYSLIEAINGPRVILMDPWTAREGKYNQLLVSDFIYNWNLRGAKYISVWE